MKSADRIIGAIMAVLGMICINDAYRIWGGWDGIGSMVLITGGIFIVVSVIFLLAPSRETTSIQWPGKKEIVGMGVVGGSFALYVSFMNWLGYPLSTWLLLIVVTRYISPSRTSTLLVWTGAVAIVTYIIFRKYLFMYLPEGFMGI